jgi:hypothetical protein
VLVFGKVAGEGFVGLGQSSERISAEGELMTRNGNYLSEWVEILTTPTQYAKDHKPQDPPKPGKWYLIDHPSMGKIVRMCAGENIDRKPLWYDHGQSVGVHTYVISMDITYKELIPVEGGER